MTPEEARRQAVIQLGGVEQTKENYRDRRGIPMARDDLARYSLRLAYAAQVARFHHRCHRDSRPGNRRECGDLFPDRPGASAQPSCFPSGQLVELVSPGPETGHTWGDGIQGSSFSYPMFEDLLHQASTALQAGCWRPIRLPWTFPEREQRSACRENWSPGNYFDVLGVTPELGRVFSTYDETAPGGNPVVVLSYGFWVRSFRE